MKVTLKGHIYYRPEGDYLPAAYEFQVQDWTGFDGRVQVCPHEIEFEVPPGFDPTLTQIKQLEEKRKKATAAYRGMVADIDNQIRKLQALTMEVAK